MQKRLVRVLVVVFVLAGAIFLQYWLANIPLPVDVEKSTPLYTPTTAALIKGDELVVDMPRHVLNSPSTNLPTMLLSDEGKDLVTVEVHFESARLDDEHIKDLQENEEPLPPAGLQQISYTTAADTKASARPAGKQPEEAEPCRTFIDVESSQSERMPTELRFFQRKGPGADRYRYFEMKAVGAELVVHLETTNLARDKSAPGCTKALSIGTAEPWQHPIYSPTELKIVVPEGARIEFWFTPFRGKMAWTENGPFEPFLLQASPLSARGVRKITPLGTPVFSAKSVEGKPLLLKHLTIGSDELQLDFSGQAMVQENGEDAVTFDLWEFAKKYPLVAGLLAMLDAGLLEGLRRVVFRSTRVEKESKKPRRRGKKTRRASSGDGSS